MTTNIVFDEDYESETDQYVYKKRFLPKDLPLAPTEQDAYMSAPFEDFLKWSQMEVKDVDITRYIKEDGTPGKKFNYVAQNSNSYEVYLPDNWYCIDIDVWMRYYPSFVRELPFTVSSSKKRHYYCRIKTDVFQMLGTKQPVNVLDFDISDEEKAYNKCERGYGDILKKMWEAKDGIMYFPRGMENFQNAYFNTAFQRLLPYVKIPETTLKEEATHFDDKSSNSNDDAPQTCYAKMLDILGASWYEPFDNWRKVMWCLPQTEECRISFETWSKRCPSKYDQNSLNKQWDSCKDRNPFGFQTLLKYCRIENTLKANSLCQEFKKNKRSAENKLIFEFNATNISKYFKQSNPFGYKFNRGNWYELNKNGVWVEADGKTPYQLRSEMYDYVMKKLTDFSVETVKDNTIKEDDKKQILSKTCDAKKKLGDTTLKDKVVKELETEYLDRHLHKKLNDNRLLWAFNDCLVDLSNGTKRKIEPTDFISITCGYDYPSVVSDEDKIKAKDYLQTMFKTPDELLFCLRCMASCLRGQNLFDKWFIFKGAGGNGKGCFFDSMMKVFGNYWGVMPVEYFYTTTRKDPTRADLVALSSMYKRVLYSSEAQETDEDDKNAPKLNVAEIKKWTGKEQIKCRDNFGKVKEVVEFEPYGTCIWNTNGVPAIPVKDKQNSDALKRRLTIHEFPYTFVSTQEEIREGETHKKIGNPMIKLELQTEKMRNAIMMILLQTYDEEIKGATCIKIPEETTKTTNNFLTKEDDFVEDFMSSYYEHDETTNVKRDCIYMNFKESSQYSECKLKATIFYSIVEKLGYKMVMDKSMGARVFKNLRAKAVSFGKEEQDSGKPPM
jgi:phage/plasmid-associated DNA primase